MSVHRVSDERREDMRQGVSQAQKPDGMGNLFAVNFITYDEIGDLLDDLAEARTRIAQLEAQAGAMTYALDQIAGLGFKGSVSQQCAPVVYELDKARLIADGAVRSDAGRSIARIVEVAQELQPWGRNGYGNEQPQAFWALMDELHEAVRAHEAQP